MTDISPPFRRLSPPSRRLLRRAEAAKYLEDELGYPMKPKTLAKLAVEGGGPKFRKAGRFPLYEPAELDEWVALKLSRPVSSTSELARPSK
jgi:hypothetical protein